MYIVTLILTLFAILFVSHLTGILDRIRGTELNSYIRAGASFAYGVLLISSILLVGGLDLKDIESYFPLFLIACGGLWWVGEKPSWGGIMGDVLYPTPRVSSPTEWWRVGLLKRNNYLALAARGAMWGVPLSLMGFIYGPIMLMPMLSMAIAFPLACKIATKIHDYSILSLHIPGIMSRWELAEYFRGFLVTFISCILVSSYYIVYTH